ncbi:MAG: glycosyltransferase family 4 protein [Rhizomicrobium sp.]|jgi:glycosyltransferase involved in cell wall biosynthesis
MPGFERVILLGPVAEPGKPARGGYESANLRLSIVLETLVEHVKLRRYPQTSGSRFRRVLQYAGGFFVTFARILLHSGRGTAIHFTPLCRHFLAPELLLAAAARLRGYALTVDLRAGTQVRRYTQSTAGYRWMFRRLLLSSSAVAYEGESYGGWLKTLAPDRQLIWLPNFVPGTMLRRRREETLPASPRFIYVGAVSREKGVDSALLIFQLLRRQFPEAAFALVGACDAGYRAELDRLGLNGDGIEFTGPLSPDEVETRLDGSHFFLFLSRWFGEGHSNALTEAMARGCVPFASDHGFSASVVGAPELMVGDGDGLEQVAERIAAIWSSGRWQHFSAAMVARVADRFTDRQARQALARIYGDGASTLARAPFPRTDIV